MMVIVIRNATNGNGFISQTYMSAVISVFSIFHVAKTWRGKKCDKVITNMSQFFEPQLSITKTGHEYLISCCAFIFVSASTGCGTENRLIYKKSESQTTLTTTRTLTCFIYLVYSEENQTCWNHISICKIMYLM